MARQPWDDVFDRVRVEKSPLYVYSLRPTAADLNAAEAALGCRLPASYRAFAERFGLWGELAGWLQLHPLAKEKGEPFSVLERTQIWRDTYAGDQADDAQAVGLDFARRLIVFASDIGGNGYAFHPGEVTHKRLPEYKVYEFARIGDWKEERAETFAEVVAYIDRVVRELREEERDEDEPVEESDAIEFSPWNRRRRPFSKRDVKVWLDANSGAARNLARAIREEGRPELFPVLGDALEDAGCADPHVLRACRDGNPQADGGWLLAVLLGAPKAK